MKHPVLWLILLIGLFGCKNVDVKINEGRKNPKLVIGIVVDQMKDEYLRKFKHNFTERGFKRLMKKGYVCRNTHYNYVPTYTGPGHASIYTGTTPSEHGIVANHWYVVGADNMMYCVSDTTVSPLGTEKGSGKMSPRNLIANTVGDELKMLSNMRSKVIGVSLKDRGAILPAGHLADAAYWLEGGSGHWISSNYYFDELPQWAQQYNQSDKVNELLETPWELSTSIDNYHASLSDDNPYEGSLKKNGQPTFPYDLKEISKEKGKGIIKSTPWGNTIVFDFAKEIMQQESLGQDEFTDFLAISFSSTDYIGHLFGPNSIEVEDAYVKLDQEIASFLDLLDNEIGKDNYMLFISSDHGVSPSPLYMKDLGLMAGHYNTKDLQNDLNHSIKTKFGLDGVIARIENLNLYLNPALNLENEATIKKVKFNIQEEILKKEWVKDVFDVNHLHKHFNNKSAKLMANGYWKKRSGDMIIQTKPYWLSGGYGGKGSSHGSAYGYDTHVPLIWYGAGIPKGEDFSEISITDIAPTLAFLMNSNPPNSCSGEVISGIFRR